jgi:hypothetical protein
MSRTLRRPMFRGGRVSSYGTGIASGLADGGMPPKRGLVTGPGGYAGQQDYSGIMRPYPIYHSSMGQPQGSVLGSDLMNFVKQNPKYGSLQFANTLNANQSYSPTTYGGSRRGPQISDSPEFLKLWQNYMDPETTLIDPDQIDVETGEVTGSVSGDSISGSEGEISTTVDKVDKVDDINIDTGTETTDIIDTETSIGDSESGVQAMADKYFKLMGGDKARGQDISDMLLRFAGSEGDTTMEKFQKFAGEEGKIPSRTEKLKQAAAMLGIKGEQAKEIAAITHLGKRFAPGITQKDITYGSSLPKGSAEHTMYLRKQKLSPTLTSEARAHAADPTNLAGAYTVAEIDALGPVYYSDWGGIFAEGADQPDGTYLDITASEIIKIVDGKVDESFTEKITTQK